MQKIIFQKYCLHSKYLSTGSSSSKLSEDEGSTETLATSVVEKALEIYNHISAVIKSSTRAGGNVGVFSNEFLFII